MYSKSLGLDCQRFFFAVLLPFQIPTPGISPYWGFFKKLSKSPTQGPHTHREKTQNLKVPIHTGALHIGEKTVTSQSLHTQRPHTQVKKNVKSQSPQTQGPHTQVKKRKISKAPDSAAPHTAKKNRKIPSKSLHPQGRHTQWKKPWNLKVPTAGFLKGSDKGSEKNNVDWCIQHLGNYCYPNVDQMLKNESIIKLWVKMVAGLFFVGAKVSPETTFEKSSFSLEKRQITENPVTRFLRQNQSRTKNCEPEIR